VVSTGGNDVLDGTTPPRIAIVEGGMNTVVCSWRGKRGIGASCLHDGNRLEDGADDTIVMNRTAANKIGSNADRYIAIMKISGW
jgi:hypothetical protein